MIAEIRAEGGGLQVTPREPIPPSIQKDIVEQRGRVQEDEAFLKSLPQEFAGLYMHATLIAD